jgi:hypothetical protein
MMESASYHSSSFGKGYTMDGERSSLVQMLWSE